MMNGPFFIIKNISKKYVTRGTDFFAIKNITTEIDNRGLVCIIGKSGSGKSTFLNLLSGIEKLTSGTILFKGRNISKLSDKQFSRYHLNDISLVYQHYNLFQDFTSIENVQIPLLMKGVSNSSSLRTANKFFEDFRLSDLKNKKVDILSGGEKQRVAIIRALVSDPSVILCDEPTGALDKKNSILIMEILKKISLNKLVIVVSHNNELVEKYADRIIKFKDGQIIEDKSKSFKQENLICERKINKYSSKWINLFLKLNLKRNIKKIVLSMVTLIIGFSSVFLSVGFSNGASKSQQEALETNLAMTYSTVSETSYIKIDNSPLSFEKNIKPSPSLIDEKIIGFNTLEYAENLSYFYTNFPKGKYMNKEVDNFEMIPLFNISENNYRTSLLISGSLPNENIEEIIVNREFVNLLGENIENIINKVFSISYSVEFSVSSKNSQEPIIKDTFSYDLNLKIKGVVGEFSFLNQPKIYYSYESSKRFLKGQFSNPVSLERGEPVSYYDLINEASNDSVMTSYSSIIFLKSLKEKDEYFKLIKNLLDNKDKLTINSTAYEIQSSYITFIDSFSSMLYVFVLIAFLGINFIIGMISLSNFIQNKKETAILTCLGARNKSIILIYLIENYFILFITIMLSIFSSLFLQNTINKLISQKFTLNKLIDIPLKNFLSINFGLPITIFLISALVITLFTLIPLFIYRKVSLVDELRDE